MEAKDGSTGFDFGGTYDEVVPNKRIKYTLDDGRMMDIAFLPIGQAGAKANNGVTITETFEPENQNPIDMQRQGWQAILDNFKIYVESNQSRND